MSKIPAELDRYPLLYESLAVSETKWVTAVKSKTSLPATLGVIEDGAWRDVHAKEEYVGKTVTLAGTLYDAAMNPVAGKTINIYNQVDAEGWSKISTPKTDSSGNIKLNYVLVREGKHQFYIEFEGDAQYEGCSKQLFTLAR